MVQFDNENRLIKIKIVYYGPAVGGKTTSLQHIHKVVDPERRTRLYSLNTAADRTLFFDLLSLDFGRIRDFRLALQLYTVPGQVQYDATRRMVLAGVDGVVFVADSQLDQREANTGSLQNLGVNLSANKLDLSEIPLVFQYNKRDLEPIQSIAEMEEALNPTRRPSFPTIATSGEGILEAFAGIGELTLMSVADKLGIGDNTQALDRLRRQMGKAMEPFLATDGTAREADDIEVTVAESEDGELASLSDGGLVEESVRANLAMGDLSTQFDSLSRSLERKVRVMAGISEFGHAVSNERDPAAVLKLLISTAVDLLQVQGASALITPSSGELREAVVHGYTADPLCRAVDGQGRTLAADLLERRSPLLVTMMNAESGSAEIIASLQNAEFASAVVAPIETQDKIIGLLTAYGTTDRTDLDDNDVQLATVLASTAAMGYANAIAWQQKEEIGRGLEAQVAERTSELERALAESQRLAHDLAEKQSLLESTYRDLAELDGVKNELINRLSLEFRTPITSLSTAARILRRDDNVPPDKADRLVTIIHDESAKLLEMIQSIFQVSVLGGAKRRVETLPVPAQELIRQAVAPLRDLAKDRGVGLQVLLPSGLDTVVCERESVEAALRAVLRNAVDFSGPNSDVKLEVRRTTRGDQPWLQLRVSDRGAGIAEADLEHVREAFWQKDDAAVGKRHGVGLGLAIADRVARNHGGELIITSALGKGTSVVLAIPQ